MQLLTVSQNAALHATSSQCHQNGWKTIASLNTAWPGIVLDLLMSVTACGATDNQQDDNTSALEHVPSHGPSKTHLDSAFWSCRLCLASVATASAVPKPFP